MCAIIEALIAIAVLLVVRRIWKKEKDLSNEWKVIMTITAAFIVVVTVVGWFI